MNKKREKFLVFGAPDIQDAEIEEVVKVLKSGWLGSGPRVAKFESDFSSYKGLNPNHAAAVNSCTAALHLAVVASNLKPGDEVITTALTFCATVNSIIHAGATPVLVDVNPHTMNMDPDAVAAAITPRTRAIVPVHFAGRSCDMDSLTAIAQRNELVIIEDCAHALETTYNGRHAGTIGDFGCFSFYVTKNLVTGEGGMVLAKNEALIQRIKVLALHGLSKDAWKRYGDTGFVHYDVQECGFKYNMMDLQAAIGIHQLQRLESNWQRRKAIWEQYQAAFADLPVVCPSPPEDGCRHGYHLFTLLIDPKQTNLSRDQFLDAMQARNIGAGVHYRSIPEHKFYKERFHWNCDDYPNAKLIGQQTASIPLSPNLNNQDVEDVINAVKSTVG